MRSPLPCSFAALLCTCGLALMTACGPTNTTAEAPAAEPTVVKTNIRLAKRNAANEFVEGTEFTRDADHIEQIMPALFQNEGPAWENDNIAFRMYWDKRNGIDIHGKKVSDMVLDTVGLDRNNYHEMSDWGMDALKAGNSLGAGTIALMIDGQVYRIGDAAEEKVRITEETAERSSFLLEYRGLEIAGRTLELDWAISIEAGTHHYEADVTFRGLTGGESLLIGIVNLHSDTLYTTQKDGRYVAYTHAPQAEGDYYLGMAASVDQAAYLSTGELAPDAQPVSSTYYLEAKLAEGQTTSYRFTAGWAPGHPEFKERMAFLAAVR